MKVSQSNWGTSLVAALGLLSTFALLGPATASADEGPSGSIAGVWLEAGQIPDDPSSDISLSAIPDAGGPAIPCDIDPITADFICSGLPAGQYRLRASVDHYIGESAQGLFGAPDGGPITVAAGSQAAGVVVNWAVIHGTYTSDGTALPPVAWLKAKAYDASTGALVAQEYRQATTLHRRDQFRLRVPPGNYLVHFDTRDRTVMEGQWGAMWESQWYPGVSEQAQAEVVSVAPGGAYEMDPDLRSLTSLYGTGLLYCEIEALDLAGRTIGATRGDPWGTWVITGLPLGSYKLRWREPVDPEADPPAWNWFHGGSDFQSAHILDLRSEGQHLLVVGPTVPTAPLQVTATAAERSIVISWADPARDGGYPVTSFTAWAQPGGATCTASSLSCTITGLEPATSYSVTVVATNERGTSHPSEEVLVRTLTPASPPTEPGQEGQSQGPGAASALPTTAPGEFPVAAEAAATVGASGALPPTVSFRTGQRRDGRLRASITGIPAAKQAAVILHWCNVRVSGKSCDPLRARRRGATSALAADGSVTLDLAGRRCRAGATNCAGTWGRLRTRKGDRVRIVAVTRFSNASSVAGAPVLVKL